MNNEPVVSICCIAYKHENYIRECLEGFVMQKTNFPFEVIIHDDASPDKTADIIREYEARYPDIIKPIYQTENQYSQKIKPLWEFVFPKVRGKYIAICEGDDFWCDPDKLQIQYDFMEANPDYSLCMHGRYEIDHFLRYYLPVPFIKNFPEDGTEFALRTACREYLFSTQTMFIRKSCLDKKRNDIIRDIKNAPMGDLQLAFHLALSGKVKNLDRRMAVYRRAPNSASNNAVGARPDFERRADIAVETMIKNAGFHHWITERHKCMRWRAIIQFFLLPVRAFNLIAKKYCLLPYFMAARKDYLAYMTDKNFFSNEL